MKDSVPNRKYGEKEKIVKPKGKPNDIDVVIGQNLRKFRKQRGETQSYLASKIGVTFQQFQKYEYAVNRVSASRLIILAEALEVPLDYFYPKEYQIIMQRILWQNLNWTEQYETKLALLAGYKTGE